MSVIGRLSVLIAMYCLTARSGASTSAEKGVRPIGGGAFPLSLTHASAWFAHSADNNEKVLTFVIFLPG
jgi:hypothetical protein